MEESSYPVCDVQILEEEQKGSDGSPNKFTNNDDDSSEKHRVQRVLEDFGFGDVKN